MHVHGQTCIGVDKDMKLYRECRVQQFDPNVLLRRSRLTDLKVDERLVRVELLGVVHEAEPVPVVLLLDRLDVQVARVVAS